MTLIHPTYYFVQLYSVCDQKKSLEPGVRPNSIIPHYCVNDLKLTKIKKA